MMRRPLLLLALALPLLAGAPARAQGGAAAQHGATAASTPSPAAPAPATTAPDVAAPNPAAGASPAASARAQAPAPASGPAAAPAGVPNAGPIPNTAPVTMPAASPTGSLLQTLFALIVVLGVLGALAWFLKRYGPRAGGANANVKIVGSLNLGGRERLLVVEIGNQWIVVGASPGRVNGLATMPKQEGVDSTATLATPGPSANNFADWLRQTIDKRK
jgi:flagellar biosynthetic protein FliO